MARSVELSRPSPEPSPAHSSSAPSSPNCRPAIRAINPSPVKPRPPATASTVSLPAPQRSPPDYPSLASLNRDLPSSRPPSRALRHARSLSSTIAYSLSSRYRASERAARPASPASDVATRASSSPPPPPPRPQADLPRASMPFMDRLAARFFKPPLSSQARESKATPTLQPGSPRPAVKGRKKLARLLRRRTPKPQKAVLATQTDMPDPAWVDEDDEGRAPHAGAHAAVTPGRETRKRPRVSGGSARSRMAKEEVEEGVKGPGVGEGSSTAKAATYYGARGPPSRLCASLRTRNPVADLPSQRVARPARSLSLRLAPLARPRPRPPSPRPLVQQEAPPPRPLACVPPQGDQPPAACRAPRERGRAVWAGGRVGRGAARGGGAEGEPEELEERRGREGDGGGGRVWLHCGGGGCRRGAFPERSCHSTFLTFSLSLRSSTTVTKRLKTSSLPLTTPKSPSSTSSAAPSRAHRRPHLPRLASFVVRAPPRPQCRPRSLSTAETPFTSIGRHRPCRARRCGTLRRRAARLTPTLPPGLLAPHVQLPTPHARTHSRPAPPRQRAAPRRARPTRARRRATPRRTTSPRPRSSRR